MDEGTELVLKALEESRSLRTDEDRRGFVRRHCWSSCFINLLRCSYSPLRWYGPVVAPEGGRVLPTASAGHLSFKGMTLLEAVSLMEDERSSFGGRAWSILSGYSRENPELGAVLEGVVRKDLFGLSPEVINEAAGFRWIEEIGCPEPVKFREDFFVNPDRWWRFARIEEGCLAVVLRNGRTCEVLSRSGRQYQMLDGLRKAFSKVVFDGVFTIQLSFAGKDGAPDRHQFFSETARKGQSDSWMADVIDWTPVSAIGGRCDVTWEDRRIMAALAVKQAADRRITYCSPVRCDGSPPSGSFVVRGESRSARPKDFMVVQAGKER